MSQPPTDHEPSMSELFSDFVARLGADGESLDMASYEEVRKELRSVLVTEMKRRGLWNAPPSYLGIIAEKWGKDALDELVTDAYSYIFIRKLRGLRNQQRIRGDIRPLVIRNVRFFLTERQKKADPLGYNVFKRLQKAVEIVIDRGEILVVAETPEAAKRAFGNGTLLTFEPGPAPLTPKSHFEELAPRWNDKLLPGLITAVGPAVAVVVRRLTEMIIALKADGVSTFRFGDLIAELKGDARKRWEGVWEKTLGPLVTESGDPDDARPPVLSEWPNEEPDWPRRLSLIHDCVASAIDAQRKPKSRRDLWSLWQLIHSTRVLPQEVGPMPPFAELGRQLKLTRDRVRQLFERLRPMVQACLQYAGHRPEPEPFWKKSQTTRSPDGGGRCHG